MASTTPKPTPGRVVHFVCRNADGQDVHRPAFVIEPLPEFGGLDACLHVHLKPGDVIGGGVKASGGESGLLVNVERAAFQLSEEGPALGTWHWPEGAPAR